MEKNLLNKLLKRRMDGGAEESNIDADKLAGAILEAWKSEGFDIDDMRLYLACDLDTGALAEFVMANAVDYGCDLDDNMLELCTILKSCGVTAYGISQFLESVRGEWDYGFYLMISGESDEWTALGIDYTKYVQNYLTYISTPFVTTAVVKDEIDSLPMLLRNVVLGMALEGMDTEDIFYMKDDLEELVTEFSERGVDLKMLGNKFVGEIGYEKADWLAIWYACCLLRHDCNALDADAVIKCLGRLDPGDREDFSELLRKGGVSEEKLAKVTA